MNSIAEGVRVAQILGNEFCFGYLCLHCIQPLLTGACAPAALLALFAVRGSPSRNQSRENGRCGSHRKSPWIGGCACTLTSCNRPRRGAASYKAVAPELSFVAEQIRGHSGHQRHGSPDPPEKARDGTRHPLSCQRRRRNVADDTHALFVGILLQGVPLPENRYCRKVWNSTSSESSFRQCSSAAGFR